VPNPSVASLVTSAGMAGALSTVSLWCRSRTGECEQKVNRNDIGTYPSTLPLVCLLPSLCHRCSVLTEKGGYIRMNIDHNGIDLLGELTWRVIPVFDAASHDSRGRGSQCGEDLGFTVIAKDDP